MAKEIALKGIMALTPVKEIQFVEQAPNYSRADLELVVM